MVVLRVPQNDVDIDDEDIGCSWEEMVFKQHRGDFGEITKETLEEGDTIAMLDRNCIAEKFTTRVFVKVATEDYVMVFDENGAVIDDPSNFVKGGWQKLRGDHGFFEEWTENDDGYYQLPPAPTEALAGCADAGAGRGAGAGAGEGAGELSSAPAFASDIMKVKTRIAEHFNCDGVSKQDGGLVVAVDEGVSCLIAFDDGRLEPHSLDQVKWLLDNKTLGLLGDEPRGLVEGEWRGTRALETSLLKVGSEYAPVGVLLGDHTLTLCKQQIYTAHYLSASQLEAAQGSGAAPVRRPTRGGGGAGDDKQGGLATFRRGDCVVHTGASGAQAPAEEIVFGLMSFFHRRQQYRYLITFDDTREEFSISSWTAWRRVPAAGVDLSDVKVCDDATEASMCALYTSAPLTSTSLDTLHKDSTLGPARDRAARETERKEKEKQQRALRKATKQQRERETRERETREHETRECQESERETRERNGGGGGSGGGGGGGHCGGGGYRGGGGQRGGGGGDIQAAAPQGGASSPSPPRSVKKLKREIRGLEDAQRVVACPERARELGEKREELDERKESHKKRGKW